MSVRFESCEVLEERPLALRVAVPDLVESPVWIPKSGIHDDSECYQDGDTGDLVVHDWFAETRSWI